jgi:hypothetical protein
VPEEKEKAMGLAWRQGPLATRSVGQFLLASRLPERLLFAEPLPRRMCVRFGGQRGRARTGDAHDETSRARADGVVQRSRRRQHAQRAAWQYTDLPSTPRWYVPREDIDESALTPAEGQTFCPYKGLESRHPARGRQKAYTDSEPPRRVPMTKASRVPVIGVLLMGLLGPPAPVSAQQRPAIADQLAKTYGLDSWGQIDAIRYTFTKEGAPKVSRSWVWEPKTDQISYEGKDKAGNPVKVTYSRSQLASQSAVVKDEVDPSFLNDQYWLLFPFHLVWDTGAAVEDAGMQKLPLGKGSAEKVVVKYPSNVGYTPGDTWELYVGTDGRIREFVFHHGGAAKPSVIIAKWADYKKAGPLLVSLDHPGKADGKPFHLFFSNVAVKLVGSSTWVNAQ